MLEGRCDRLLCKIINNILHVISIPQIFVHAEKEKKLKMVRGHRFPTIGHNNFEFMTDMSFCLLSMLISIEKELTLILVILSGCVGNAVSGVKCSTR
jgi:hypothetical protein